MNECARLGRALSIRVARDHMGTRSEVMEAPEEEEDSEEEEEWLVDCSVPSRAALLSLIRTRHPLLARRRRLLRL